MGELTRSFVDWSQLLAVAERLLEVIADHLLDLGPAVARRAVEPAGEQLVELRTLRLGQPLVGCVADEHVAEPERIAPGEPRTIRADELLADEPDEVCGEPQRGPRWATGRRPTAGRRRVPRPTRARPPPAPRAPAGRGVRRAAPGSSAARRSTRDPAWPSSRRRRSPARRRRSASRGTPRRRGDCPRPPSAIRARTARGSAPPGTRASINSSAGPSASGSSRIVVALSLPPPQVGRSSRNSGRAGQMKRIGESRARSATDSMRSSRVGSAQWMSSTRTTSGRSSARCSRARRNAQTSSSWAADTSRPTSPTSPRAIAAASGSPATKVVDPLARRLRVVAVIDPGRLPDDLGDRPDR